VVQSIPSGTRYTRCKASAVSAENLAVFDPINAWLLAHRHAPRPPQLPGTVTSSDGVAGVAKGNDCSFSIEPYVGLFINAYLSGAVSKAVVWGGLETDEIDTDTSGNVVYLHAGDWASASGGAEMNFPGVTGGTVIEAVYGSANQFLMCHLE
jgi:hypothetical protein